MEINQTNSENVEQTAGVEATESSGQEALSSGIGLDNANVGAESGEQGTDENTESGIGEAPETEEEKFAKEYVGKPESGYDFKDIELPEGMTLNEELTEGLKDLAGKYNMSQKGANDLMAMGVKLTENATAKFLESVTAKCTEQNNKFCEALKADPEIGGSKLEETKRVANVAYKHYFGADKEVSDLIQGSGLVNNKAFVKMLNDVGLQMQDPAIVTGAAANTKKSTAEIWYGKK